MFSPTGYRGRLVGLLGPVRTLLDLIRNKRMPAKDVPAGQLASSAHDYVKTSSPLPLDEMGEFAVDLSCIVLLKSRELTPWLQVEDLEVMTTIPSQDGDARLDQFESGVLTLGAKLSEGVEAFSRLEFNPGAERIPVSIPLSPTLLRQGFERQILSARARDEARIQPPIFLRIEIAIKSLQTSLRRLKSLTFHGVIRDQSLDRRGTIVYFLAVLDMARRGIIQVQQERPFRDIIVLTAGDGTSLPALSEEMAG